VPPVCARCYLLHVCIFIIISYRIRKFCFGKGTFYLLGTSEVQGTVCGVPHPPPTTFQCPRLSTPTTSAAFPNVYPIVTLMTSQSSCLFFSSPRAMACFRCASIARVSTSSKSVPVLFFLQNGQPPSRRYANSNDMERK